MVGAALKMGGIVAETSKENCDLIYDFGLNLGIAFQLQDDYLDAFGDPATFGKQVGGDIIENKKTYLYLKALEQSNEFEKQNLRQWFSVRPEDSSDKIVAVKNIFRHTGADTATRATIELYTKKAFATLGQMDIGEDKKTVLKDFGESLMARNV